MMPMGPYKHLDPDSRENLAQLYTDRMRLNVSSPTEWQCSDVTVVEEDILVKGSASRQGTTVDKNGGADESVHKDVGGQIKRRKMAKLCCKPVWRTNRNSTNRGDLLPQDDLRKSHTDGKTTLHYKD